MCERWFIEHFADFSPTPVIPLASQQQLEGQCTLYVYKP